MLQHPSGMAQDLQGRRYVADSGKRRLQVWQADGTWLAALGHDGLLRAPTSVAINAAGQVYVVDAGSSAC